MVTIECKVCGGRNNVEEGQGSYRCAFCGTLQMMPNAKEQRQIDRLNRANYFRRQGEYDRAAETLEQMTEEQPDDAELHWNLALVRYGIEYVTDPKGGGAKPTCHRVQTTSILDDPDYQKAVALASDGETRQAYQDSAEEISRVQKRLLAVVQEERPYDVFICYKETAKDGSRTQDSVYAEELYNMLIREGLRVFYAKRTLEDKLGTEYEPYIFAALNSARVMLLVAADAENVSAVWVRNEWSRYITFMRLDPAKILIPCCYGISPYELPDELSPYQGMDMGRAGAKQDLVAQADEKKKLLGKDYKIEEPDYYLAVLLTYAGVRNLQELSNSYLPIGNNPGYKGFMETAGPEQREEVRACREAIREKAGEMAEEFFMFLPDRVNRMPLELFASGEQKQNYLNEADALNSAKEAEQSLAKSRTKVESFRWNIGSPFGWALMIANLIILIPMLLDSGGEIDFVEVVLGIFAGIGAVITAVSIYINGLPEVWETDYYYGEHAQASARVEEQQKKVDALSVELQKEKNVYVRMAERASDLRQQLAQEYRDNEKVMAIIGNQYAEDQDVLSLLNRCMKGSQNEFSY